MEWVSGTPDWENLGRTLAGVHRRTADAFGYAIDNVIGPLPQHNPWTADWPTFFIEHRLRPHIEYLPTDLARRLDAACERFAGMLDHRPIPSLIHGDLWVGNIVDGQYLIDPAVSYSDR